MLSGRLQKQEGATFGDFLDSSIERAHELS
jgi:hypothetical protein